MDYYQEKGEDPLVMALRLDPQLIKSLVLSTTILGMKYLLSVCAKTIPDRTWFTWLASLLDEMTSSVVLKDSQQ